MPTTATSLVLYVRVTSRLKTQIKRDARAQGRTEAEVVRRILKAHYDKNQEPSD